MNKHVKVKKSSSVAALPVKVGVINAARGIMAFAVIHVRIQLSDSQPIMGNRKSITEHVGLGVVIKGATHA